MNNRGTLIVISGFSGVGKGTMVKKLMEDYDNYSLSVSMTTRKPRDGEVHGTHYFFVSKEVFEGKISLDGFLEYATYCGNYYGTPRDYVEEKLSEGKNVILEIEIQGAMKVKEKLPEAVLLFVMPPSMEELKRRLVGRGTETEDVIDTRLRRAMEESEGIERYDYIIINDDLVTAVEELHEMIEQKFKLEDRACRPEDFKNLIKSCRTELKALVKGE